MIELKEIEDKKAWDQICMEHGTIFHLWGWLQTVRDVYKANLKSVGVFEKRELIGVFPLFTCKKGFNLLMSPLHGSATPYGGPVLRGKANEKSKIYTEILRSLSDSSYSRRSHFTYIVSSPMLSHEDYIRYARLAYDLGKVDPVYEFANEYTLLLDLTKSQDDLWRNLGKNCRTAVKKALKSEVEVVEMSSKEIIDDYYLMAKDIYRRSNQEPGIPREMFTRICETFEPNKKIKILVALHKNDIVAAAIFLFHRGVVYYWDSVSYRTYSNLAPNNLIQWKIIQWGAENGYGSYDLLGLGMPKIADFKLSFGGEIAPSFVLTRYKNLYVRLAAGIYEKAFPVYRRWNYRLRRNLRRNV